VYFAFLETIPGYKVQAGEKETINFKAAASQYENGNYGKAIISLNNDKMDTRLEAQEGALSSAYLIGNAEAVLAYADKVLKNSDVTTEQRALANFYVGKVAFDREEYLDALRAFNEVTKISNNEEAAEARYLIAYVYYVQRDLEVAEQITLNAQAESSEYPYWAGKSIILLADILAEKGDVLNARAVLEGWIESYTEDEDLLNIAKKKLEQLKAREAASNRLITTPLDTETLDLQEEQ